MPFVYTRTDVKPAHVEFQHRHNDGGILNVVEEERTLDEHARLEHLRWVIAYPGVLSHIGEAIDEHTWRTTIVFKDEDAYNNYVSDVVTQPVVIARKAWAKEHGVVSTFETKTV